MLILTVMLAMVAPSLGGFGRGREAQNAAANLLSLSRWAREQAITEGRVYRLNFDPAEGAYWVTAAYGGTFETLPVEFGRRFVLPESVTAEWSAPAEGGYPYAEFLPSGRSRPVRIRVFASDGQFVDLASLSATEPMKVLTPDEQEEVAAR